MRQPRQRSRGMARQCASLATLLFCAATFSSAEAQTLITWDGGGDGISYNDPLNWDLDVVPTNAGPDEYDVVIPMGATVSLAGDFDTAAISPTVNSVDNSGQLEMTSQTLTINAQVNGLVNGGSILQTGIAATSSLVFAAPPTGANEFNAVNMGLIQCAAGTLNLNGAVMMQDQAGVIDVADGKVRFQGQPVVIGGTLISSPMGDPPAEFFVGSGSTTTLESLVLDGTFRINVSINLNSALQIDQLGLTDNTVIEIDSDNGNHTALLELLSDQVFDGAGEIRFTGVGGELRNVLSVPADRTLTVGPEFRIVTATPQVQGRIVGASPSLSTIINEGTIAAAASGSSLYVRSITIDNGPTGLVATEGVDSEMYLFSNTEILGGTVRNLVGDLAVLSGNTAILRNTLLDGTFRINVSSTNSSSALQIDQLGLTDGTVIEIDSDNGNHTALLELLSDQVFDGAGEIRFTGVGGELRNVLSVPADRTLTVGPEFRIVTATPQQQGRIIGASSSLSTIVNEGTIAAAASGSGLYVRSITIDNGPTGLVATEGVDSEMYLFSNTEILGGTVRNLVGDLAVLSGNTAILRNTLLDGTFRINVSINLNSALQIDQLGLTDNTVIEIDSDNGNHTALLELLSDQVFDGAGEIRFTGVGGELRNVLSVPADRTLTVGPEFRIVTATPQVQGRIVGASPSLSTIINEGTIAAAASGSGLNIFSIAIDNGPAGILATEGLDSEVYLYSNTEITGGTVRNLVGELAVLSGNTVVLRNTLLDGTLRVNANNANGATLQIDQLGLTDNTVVEIEGDSGTALLDLLSDQVFDGAGEIRFTGIAGISRNILQVPAGIAATLGSSFTIQAGLASPGGTVRGVDLTSRFTNNGTIAAEGDDSVILLQGPMRFPAATGTLRATNGTIRVSGVSGPLGRAARVAAHLETGVAGDITDGEIGFQNGADVDGIQTITNRGVMRFDGSTTRVEGALSAFSTTGIMRIENSADLVLTSALPIELDGIVSLDVAGSFLFSVGGFDFAETVRFFCGGQVETFGDVVFRQNDFMIQTEENDGNFFWEPSGQLVIRGNGGGGPNLCGGDSSLLEAAGRDDGPNAPVATQAGIQKLNVGTNSQVTLVDQIDNGNRNGSVGAAEAVYVNVLTIEPGGLLNLGVVNLYVNGTAIQPGAFDQGTIIRSGEDCDGNGVPDGCDLEQCDGDPSCGDCNGNGIPDACDIDEGLLSDCSGNGIPDQCEPDCNLNGLADSCDILGGFSLDCNGNAIPDECEIPTERGPDFFCTVNCDPDCNFNGIPDECDIVDCAGTPDCGDCNNNGVPDSCDIAAGTSMDVDMNGIPDECVTYEPDMGNPNLWSFAPNWPNDDVPGDEDPALVESVLLSEVGGMPTALDLDIDVSIDSFVVAQNSSLDFVLGTDATRRFTIDSPNGIRVNGAINVNVPGEIFATAPFAIRGNQPINLNDPGAQIRSSQDGNIITNFTTIQGQGTISAQFSNRGNVVANTDGASLIITGGLSKENVGSLRAENNGTLEIVNTNIGGAGTLTANGGNMTIDPGIGIANVSALSLNVINSGLVEARGNSNLTLAGNLTVATAGFYRGTIDSDSDLAAANVLIDGFGGPSTIELDGTMQTTVTGTTTIDGECEGRGSGGFSGPRGINDPTLRLLRDSRWITMDLVANAGDIFVDADATFDVMGDMHLGGCSTLTTGPGALTNMSTTGATVTDGALVELDGNTIMTVATDLVIDGCVTNEQNCDLPEINLSGASTLVVGSDLLLDGDSTIQVAPSALVMVSGDFVHRSQDAPRFAWNGKLILDGMMQSFELPAEDRGPIPSGAVDNFAFGELEVAAGTTVAFVDGFDNSPGAGCEALYVTTLRLGAGALLQIDDCNIYYQSLIDDGAIIQTTTGAVICAAAGDFDCDGQITPDEVSDAIDAIIGNPVDSSVMAGSDFNGDGLVDGRDIQGLIDRLIQP